MLSILSYPYNLLCNIYTIICYIKEIYCSGNYEYLYSTTLIVMFQILKFNAKIIEYHKNIKLKKKFCSKVISQKQTSISILVNIITIFIVLI